MIRGRLGPVSGRMWLALLLACTPPEAPPAPAGPPGPCEIAAAPAGGPLSAEAAGLAPVALASLRIREARLTGDPGFYTLAQAAADCALERDPADVAARRARTHVLIQFHEFAAAEAEATALVAETGAWEDHLLLGDAAMERGALGAAKVAYDRALELRPGPLPYDRMSAWLWATGDAAGALRYAEAAAGGGGDAEPLAWALTRVGWLRALRGEPPIELARALALLPDYPPARFARGRILLHAGDPRAEADLRAAGPTVEAVRALVELDPRADVARLAAQDPRGYAIWLSDREPARALALLTEEREAREDAATLLAWAYAAHRAGQDAKDVARAAIATGTLEPRSLLQGGIVLADEALLERALTTGPGLLPAERALAERELARIALTHVGGGH